MYKKKKIMCVKIFLLVLLICGLVISEIDAEVCKELSPCKCAYPNNQGIDLTSVHSAIATSSNGSWTLVYQPCPSEHAGLCPADTAICNKTGNQLTILANYDHVIFGENATDKSIFIQYSHQASANSSNTTSVILVCAQDQINSSLQIETPERLILRGQSSCLTSLGPAPPTPAPTPTPTPTPTPPPPAVEEGMSSGSLLVILFLVFASLYLVGGVLVLKFIRGASGVEVIPHYEFWSDLPFLVKDGITFTLSGCQGAASYDRI